MTNYIVMNISKVAIFPGSFDPFTNGHFDVARRACKLFDKLLIAVGENNEKKCIFTPKERVNLIEQSIKNEPWAFKVRVLCYSCLTIDIAREMGAVVIIRGIRSFNDFEQELGLADVNYKLYPNVETIFMTPDRNNTFICSSIVKEIVKRGGDIRKFVPENINFALLQKYTDSLK